MSGATEKDYPEFSEGIAENESSDLYSVHYLGVKETFDPAYRDMAESRLKSEMDENRVMLGAGTVTKLKLDPKDPLRPRRKKARRACFACQRAHLTCGDERPCQRCIKRGLAGDCQDGVRKKAKYLHDTSNEALRSTLGANYNPINHSPSINDAVVTRRDSDASPRTESFLSSEAAPPYPNAFSQPNPMLLPHSTRLSYHGQGTPMSPPFSRQGSGHSISMPQPTSDNRVPFEAPVFAQVINPPPLFNMDLEGLNFGNHCGALGFGMLGHISSGISDALAKDPLQPEHISTSQSLGVINFGSDIYSNNMTPYDAIFSNNVMDFGEISGNQIQSVPKGLPHGYAMATGPHSQYSPSTEETPSINGVYDISPTTTTFTQNHSQHHPTLQPHKPPKHISTNSIGKPGTIPLTKKRSRDSSAVYNNVREPYSYTAGFHNLTTFLQRRFPAHVILRIAKSLASIRPSFIACARTLTRQDLIFMETCFQRTLFEYEEFMHHCCTPTIICRRTGEIAAVNNEFSLLTGWRKDILLGRTGNLDINRGDDLSANACPQVKPDQSIRQDSSSQPVFLAELLDDDSVVEFYEDFARLAFNDSRGSVTTQCKLLKYCAHSQKFTRYSSVCAVPDDCNFEGPEDNGGKRIEGTLHGSTIDPRKEFWGVDNKHGIEYLERDGKLNCSYCWTVKRDVFDIPMLIVLNVGHSPLQTPSWTQMRSILTAFYVFSSCLASEHHPIVLLSYHLGIVSQNILLRRQS
ncbi:Bgt-2581 [Blumeria graminis f. sp. tritici]|uniref:Bgt-2581 n=2 Tax=Blumeria graminis f. sp. tritici TaxID=62690 RepID=A0A381LED4_BLUGR|nr:hypothetical protein BGT96224_2581 [Blumeria graminis f. sp. tritici 96224]VDB88135.1 Bgt-2581 [Blumeria graminis f. sp. tritici]